MLVLLDGPDGAGKTTLANAIADRVPGTHIIKKNAPTLPALVEYTADLAKYSPGAGISVVGDRWHIGERVYGPLYRGGCSLSPVHWGAVESFLYGLGAFLTLVVADPRVLYDRLVARGEDPDYQQLVDEMDAFNRAVTWTGLVGRAFNTSACPVGREYDEMVDVIVNLAKKEEQRALEDR